MTSVNLKEGNTIYLASICDGCGRRLKGSMPEGWMHTLGQWKSPYDMLPTVRHICPACYAEGKQ